MVTMNQIEELSRRIGREFDAERIVLFGSYAHGVATDDSDVDLLVVAETALPPRKRYGAVRRFLGGRDEVFAPFHSGHEYRFRARMARPRPDGTLGSSTVFHKFHNYLSRRL